MLRRGVSAVTVTVFVSALTLCAENSDLRAGAFLIAKKDLPDPNFEDSVVLLIEHNQRGAMGLIINWQSRVPISRALRQVEEAKGRKDPIYVGGPVERAGVLALLRSSHKPEDAQHVFADVYLISSREFLRKTLASDIDSAALHLYLGYSGWGAGQLEKEIALGTWHILAGDAASVFDPNPEALWPRLIRRTEQRVAGNRRSVDALSHRFSEPSQFFDREFLSRCNISAPDLFVSANLIRQ